MSRETLQERRAGRRRARSRFFFPPRRAVTPARETLTLGKFPEVTSEVKKIPPSAMGRRGGVFRWGCGQGRDAPSGGVTAQWSRPPCVLRCVRCVARGKK